MISINNSTKYLQLSNKLGDTKIAEKLNSCPELRLYPTKDSLNYESNLRDAG